MLILHQIYNFTELTCAYIDSSLQAGLISKVYLKDRLNKIDYFFLFRWIQNTKREIKLN